MELPALIVNVGLFVVSAGAAAIAWWQAIVASKAQAGAVAAEASTLRARRDASDALAKANEISAVSLRAPYAAALSEYGSDLLQGKLVPSTARHPLVVMANHTKKLTATGLASGEDTTVLASWVGAYITQLEVDPGDWAAAVKDAGILDQRLRRWVRSPESALAEIRSDPRANMRGFAGFEDV
ncbi:hypothetical protein [Microbacterium sp.]|uniref:hypothetical protein n=1 Tax=Microbacterium sp. TaxID=51671 RepID=UPI003F6FE0D7